MESSVYAQVSGYIKSWHVDIGAQGEAGPAAGRDRDARDRPAAAAGAGERSARPRRTSKLAKVTAARYNDLLATHAVSQQDVDNQNANVAGAGGQRRRRAGRRVSGIEKALGLQAGARAVRRRGHRAPRRRGRSRHRRRRHVPSSGGRPCAGTTRPPATRPSSSASRRRASLRVYVNVPEHYSRRRSFPASRRRSSWPPTRTRA